LSANYGVNCRHGQQAASRRWNPAFLKGLRAIEGLTGLRRRMAVYLGKERLRPEKGIEVLPLDAFLAEVERGLG